MSAKDGFEGEILDLLFLNEPIVGIGDSNGILGSVSAGNFFVALYTVTPSDSDQGTECDYDGYARVAVPRNASGFVRDGNAISNASALAFPQCASGETDTAVAFTLNKASGVDVDDGILWGPLTSNLDISVGVTPEYNIGDLVINID